MAADAGERTEPATPRRRNEARARGQIPRSADLVAAVLLLAGFVALDFQGGSIWQGLLQLMRNGLQASAPWDLDEITPFATGAAGEMFRRLIPFLLMLFGTAAIVLFAQIGPLITLHPITPRLDKINPLAGLKRLFSGAALVSALLYLAKLFAVVLIVYTAMAGQVSAILGIAMLGLTDQFLLGAKLTFRLGVAVATAFVVLALLDYIWQRYRHERSLRMSKEEVKDELRSMEGDPAIKRRRRQLQLQMAMKRLQKDVPKADVIVTNPTHLAVAIAYDGATMPAPRVVAKGADEMALRIRKIAKEHGIPLVERKPLARALYETVEVGHYIPERFYRAIAEILAYVYELSGRLPHASRRNAEQDDVKRAVQTGIEMMAGT